MVRKFLLIVLLGAAVLLFGCVQSPGQESFSDSVLANASFNGVDVNSLRGQRAVVVVGENASVIEQYAAQRLAEYLQNQNISSELVNDSRVSSEQKQQHLFLVGNDESNSLVGQIYSSVGFPVDKKVNSTWPGPHTGVAVSARSPWNETKQMLIFAGSDKYGTRASMAGLFLNASVPIQSTIFLNYLIVENNETGPYPGVIGREVLLTNLITMPLSLTELDTAEHELFIFCPEYGIGEMQPFHCFPPKLFLITPESKLAKGFGALVSRLEISNETAALQLARAYLSVVSRVSEIQLVLVSNASQILFDENSAGNNDEFELTNPSVYASVVKPPQLQRPDGDYLITMYAWTEYGGLLLEWKIRLHGNDFSSECKVLARAVGRPYPSQYYGIEEARICSDNLFVGGDGE